MIIKHRSKPQVLLNLDAIIPRLPQYFPKLEAMKKEAAIRHKGYIGEKKVDYHLKKLSNESTILQDVTLRSQGTKFQIDTILLTDYAIYCIESKHFSHTIIFNTILNQFTQKSEIREKGFRCPISQVKNHQHQLKIWLHEHNLDNIPVHGFVAISDPSTIIKVIGDQEEVAKIVAHGEHVPFKIRDRDQIHHDNKSSTIQRNQIGAMILRQCLDSDFDIQAKYNIKQTDILTGVKCPICNILGMVYRRRVWTCKQCGYQSRHAYKQALSDYLLIFKPWIKNNEALRFLHLPSKTTTTRILRSSGLKYHKQKGGWIK